MRWPLTFLDVVSDALLFLLPLVGVEAGANDPLNPRRSYEMGGTVHVFFRNGMCDGAYDCSDGNRTKFTRGYFWTCLFLLVVRWACLLNLKGRLSFFTKG
jgi:hypothetical protein